jgi:hypothetical protein
MSAFVKRTHLVPCAGWLSVFVLGACAQSLPARGPAPVVVVEAAAPTPPVAIPPAPPKSASELTPAERVERYLPLWRAALALRCGAVPADAERELHVVEAHVDVADPQALFQTLKVHFTFEIDWAKLDLVDTIAIRIPDDPFLLAIAHDVKRSPNGWLSIDDATMFAAAPLLELAVLGTQLSRVPFRSHLAFASMDAAKAALPGSTGAQFDDRTLKFELARQNDEKQAPGLYLRGAYGRIPGKQSCLWADLNVVSGAADRSESPCGATD